MKKIVIAGGSGFLGCELAAYLQERGYAIIVLTRTPMVTKDGIREVRWDTHSPGDWTRELENAAAVVNLTGQSVNCRYHERNRKLILESRICSTRAIGEAIGQSKAPTPVWLNAGTATIYQHTLGAAWDESGEIGSTPEVNDQFSIEVATAWERTLNEAKTPATRKAALRTAMVLGRNKGSVFPMLQKLAKFGLGGKMGSGRQYVSWIHEHDFCRAAEWIISHEALSNAINVAAPNPVTNTDMMKQFREFSGRALGLPATRWMLEIGAVVLRTETELIIKSRRVVPRRLTESGFTFRFPVLRAALEDLYKRNPLCISQ